MAGDFREFFDIRKFDERKLGEVEFILNSPAYESTFKPYMEGVLKEMQRLWLDRTQQRKDQYPDDFLAGGVAFGEGLMKFFALIVNETNMERIHASMENMTNDMLYDLRREQGLVKPVVGIDQQAMPEPTDPTEDF